MFEKPTKSTATRRAVRILVLVFDVVVGVLLGMGPGQAFAADTLGSQHSYPAPADYQLPCLGPNGQQYETYPNKQCGPPGEYVPPGPPAADPNGRDTNSRPRQEWPTDPDIRCDTPTSCATKVLPGFVCDMAAGCQPPCALTGQKSTCPKPDPAYREDPKFFGGGEGHNRNDQGSSSSRSNGGNWNSGDSKPSHKQNGNSGSNSYSPTCHGSNGEPGVKQHNGSCTLNGAT
jgi:hypothetical protein